MRNRRRRLDPEAKRLNQVANAVGGRLTVEQVGRSYVISLQFMSEDPAKAASITNTMAEEYLASQVEAKYAAAERATKWLSEKIEELRGGNAQSRSSDRRVSEQQQSGQYHHG